MKWSIPTTELFRYRCLCKYVCLYVFQSMYSRYVVNPAAWDASPALFDLRFFFYVYSGNTFDILTVTVK